MVTHERWDIIFSLLVAVGILAGLLVWGTIGVVPAVGLACWCGGWTYFKFRRRTRRLRRVQESERRGDRE